MGKITKLLLVAAAVVGLTAMDAGAQTHGGRGAAVHSGGGSWGSGHGYSGGGHYTGGHYGGGHYGGGHYYGGHYYGYPYYSYYWGIPIFWGAWWGYPYYNDYYYPRAYAQPAPYYPEGYMAPPSGGYEVPPTTEVPSSEGAPTEGPLYMNYCASAKAYFPKVTSCAEGWKFIAPPR